MFLRHLDSSNKLLITVLFVHQLLSTESLSKTLYAEEESKESYWYNEAQHNLYKNLEKKLTLHPAKNVILFLGDGMGFTPMTAGRIYRGQKEGLPSEQQPLAWETFPYTAIVKTYAVDYHTTDSASSATAFLSGSKAKLETTGLGPGALWNKCQNITENSLESIAAWAVREGKWVGVVTNTKITDATPAGTYAHSPNRYWETDADIEDSEKECKDIASQLIYEFPGKEFRVILGGGRRQFLPNTTRDLEHSSTAKFGKRQDGKNLIEEWKKGVGKRHFVSNREQLESIDFSETDYLLGLFEYENMEYQLVHDLYNRTDNPTLEQMTKVAIQMLTKSPEGFFLLVEGGMIDKSFHRTIAAQALEEIRWLHKSVSTADQMTDPEDTLIVVTADHSHSINLVGYPQRNVSILGKFIDPGPSGIEVERNLDDLPSTVLVFANGPSAIYHNNTQRRNLTSVDTEAPFFKQPSFIHLASETHGGEDVGLYARGPYSHILTGTIENTYIAHAMAFALCVGPSKTYCLNRVQQKTDNLPTTESIQDNRALLVAAVVLSALCLLCFLILFLFLLARYYLYKKSSIDGNGRDNQAFDMGMR